MTPATLTRPDPVTAPLSPAEVRTALVHCGNTLRRLRALGWDTEGTRRYADTLLDLL